MTTKQQKDDKTKKQSGKEKHQTVHNKNTKNTKIIETTGIDISYISMTAKTYCVYKNANYQVQIQEV